MPAISEESSVFATRCAAEDRCRGRVTAAKLQLEMAVAQSVRLVHDPSAAPGIRANEREARAEYLRQLQIFTDLVVRGKMPGDETSD